MALRGDIRKSPQATARQSGQMSHSPRPEYNHPNARFMLGDVNHVFERPDDPTDAERNRVYLQSFQLGEYQTRLAPLQHFHAQHLTGPQAREDRNQLLQTVDQNIAGSYGRALGREVERQRANGVNRPIDPARYQIEQQVARAQGTTDAKRYHDALTTSML